MMLVMCTVFTNTIGNIFAARPIENVADILVLMLCFMSVL